MTNGCHPLKSAKKKKVLGKKSTATKASRKTKRVPAKAGDGRTA